MLEQFKKLFSRSPRKIWKYRVIRLPQLSNCPITSDNVALLPQVLYSIMHKHEISPLVLYEGIDRTEAKLIERQYFLDGAKQLNGKTLYENIAITERYNDKHNQWEPDDWTWRLSNRKRK